ncbi:MAG: hypothetical protein OXQ94_07245 [Gemmatimonadota bacterium]|nr:hypothetical protein [Gemmatimonadota bacterium]MDE2871471.1 hypothetical protein [Gemmatimonadota bacterium]
MTNIDAKPAATERGRLRSAGRRTETTTACARVAVATWWMLAGLASAGVGVQAQEAGSASLAPDENGLAVSAHFGTHLALYYLVIPVPGVSVDVIVDSGQLPVWGQVQLSGHIPGLAMGSVRLGGGGRQGAGFYALCEKAVADYRLEGCGLGGRLARDRTTFSAEATVGGHTGGDHGGYLKLNFAMHYRIGRLQ